MVCIATGVLVWPAPKEAGARWPTNVTVYLEEADIPIGEDAVLICGWWDNEGQMDGTEPFQLDNSATGTYITPTTEDEPPLGTLFFHITFVDGNGWIPEVPNTWDVTVPIDLGETNAFHWEVQADD